VNHRLLLRQSPQLRVDARVLSPVALAALSADDVRRLTLPHGRDQLPVAELFDVSAVKEGTEPSLVIEGDLSRFDAIGAGLPGGVIEIHGPVGDAAGIGMTGGRLIVGGRAGDLTGCSMRGGWLEVMGDVGDFAASALPGDMDGMRGGSLVVRGNAGERLADRMRRGTVVVFGDAGAFAASRMVAGTLAIAGRCGPHAAWGMRRGTLVFAGPAPTLSSTFVPVRANVEVFWRLLANDLARVGGPFESLAARSIERFAGDIAVQGKGELLFAR
jgi:formylmethanofuran dehydrogenase subunit C